MNMMDTAPVSKFQLSFLCFWHSVTINSKPSLGLVFRCFVHLTVFYLFLYLFSVSCERRYLNSTVRHVPLLILEAWSVKREAWSLIFIEVGRLIIWFKFENEIVKYVKTICQLCLNGFRWLTTSYFFSPAITFWIRTTPNAKMPDYSVVLSEAAPKRGYLVLGGF